jgi:site-specific recombinase XerD
MDKETYIFEKAAEVFLKKLTDQNHRNLPVIISSMQTHLIPFFGDMLLSKITTSDIEHYKNIRVNQEVSNKTINAELITLSCFFRRALKWNWLDKNPKISPYENPKKYTDKRLAHTHLNAMQIEFYFRLLRDIPIRIYFFL